jgi:hypothetical protein
MDTLKYFTRLKLQPSRSQSSVMKVCVYALGYLRGKGRNYDFAEPGGVQSKNGLQLLYTVMGKVTF